MERESFPVGYVGGVFVAGGELVLSPLHEVIVKAAPRVRLTPPKFLPAIAAARMARARLNNIALAV